MAFQIDRKTKHWLQRLDREREYANIHGIGFANALLQLYETDRLTLQTFSPIYAQLRRRQELSGYRWDRFYVYMGKVYAELKFNLNGSAPVRDFVLDQPAMGESCFEHVLETERRYGHVRLQLVSDASASQTRFEWKVPTDVRSRATIPPAFAPVIYDAIATQLDRYTQSGLRLVGAKAIICGGSFHPIDSGSLSYKVAATQALNFAINGARLLIV